MKKYIRIAGSFLFAIPFFMMFSGCDKFLDRKPLQATLDDLNQGGLEGQVLGLYSNLRNSAGFTSIPWTALHNFRSDDAEKGSDPTDGNEWVAVMDNFQYAKDFWASNTYWDDHYSIVNLANTALQTADSLKLTDDASVINVAEARFFRAFAYFDLVRTFGEVPKIDFRVYDASQANIAKSTVDEIYALIDTDLDFAETNLPTVWSAQFIGRLTSGAARTLHAKSYLYRKNWVKASEKAHEVISSGTYGLFNSYYGIFKDAGENCIESIFEIQASVDAGAVNNYSCVYATTQGTRASTASGWNNGWGWNTPTDALVNSYEAGDPRKAATILFSGQSDDPSSGGYGRTLPASIIDDPAGGLFPRKYWNKKVYADPAKKASTGLLDQAGWINMRILRYADVLLMAAEADNELGNGSSAEDLIEQIRARARSGATVLPHVAFTSTDQMRTAIKKERRAEMGMEGERFFDLVRWGDAITVLGPLGYQNRNRYYPIPQPTIDKSGGKLIQNPEY